MTASTDRALYAVDGIHPDRVVSPATVEELSTVLVETNETGEAVIPFGGGTRIHIGNVPERYTTALDMTSLSGNINHEAGDLTLVADAGVRIADLQKKLAENGQRLPFDVRSPDKATLGGSVASNAGHRMRSSSGGIRDWIIGIQVVLADGTVTKSGGKVVKNVQGYDLHRLHAGAFGTLGVISEVALNVVPVPVASSTVAAWFGSVEEAGEFGMQVFNGPMVAEALTMFTGAVAKRLTGRIGEHAANAPAVMLAKVNGGGSAISRMETELTGIAGSVGAQGYEVFRDEDATTLWDVTEQTVDDFSLQMSATLKPRDTVKLLASLTDRQDSDGFSGELEVGFGSVLVSSAEGGLQQVQSFKDSASNLGAKSLVERCSPELKKSLDVFGEPGLELALARSIKRQFDPGRSLSPGRFAGRI